ncbi:MAG: leucine-rich repeat domain-containing protein [Mycoplasmoidaceae bacterium]|nr:leucine-rich repeat domain-containing protein [Mycoplasmoidaceae bacterium]
MCSSLTSIDLSHTNLSNIGNSVFFGCSSLTSVIFPSSLSGITNAFRNCDNLISII